MQYITSVLNEWGQFVTTVVVAAESEGCYARMARGLNVPKLLHRKLYMQTTPAAGMLNNNLIIYKTPV